MSFRKFFEILFGLDSSAPPPVSDMQRWQNQLNSGVKLRDTQKYDEAYTLFDEVLVETRQAQNIVAEATVLGHLGALFTKQRQWDDAERALQQALELARSQAATPILMAAVLNDFAGFYQEKGDSSAAEKHYEQALASARKGNDPKLTAHILADLSVIYMEASNASYALRLLQEANQLTRFQNPQHVGRMGQAAIAAGNEAEGRRLIVQAYRLSHVLGDANEEAFWGNTLAHRYMEEGKMQEADRLLQRAALINTNTEETHETAQYQQILERAQVAAQIGHYENAIIFANEALGLAREAESEDTDAVVQAHSILGRAQSILGDNDAAITHLQQALDILSEQDPSAFTLDVQLDLALVQQKTDLAAAKATCQAALELAQAIDEQSQAARALNTLGNLAQQENERDKAIDYWRQAIAIYRDLGDHRHRAPILCEIANAQRDRGELKLALTNYEDALVALNSVKHRPTRGLVLSNVANVYTDTGDIDSAEAFYEESIAIARESSDKAAESLRLGNQGWFYVVTGRETKAVRLINEALSLSTAIGATLMQAVQRNNLAVAYHRLEQNNDAEENHKAALALLQEALSLPWQAASHCNYGETLASLSRYEEAQEQYEQALALGHECDDRAVVIRTLWRLGNLQRSTGKPDAAAENYDKAIHHARRHGSQRELAHALLGKAQLIAEDNPQQAVKLLEEARRLFNILFAPERVTAEQLLDKLA